MSPELLLQGRVSKASDVYALGVLLWELATGRVALQGVPLALLPHQVGGGVCVRYQIQIRTTELSRHSTRIPPEWCWGNRRLGCRKTGACDPTLYQLGRLALETFPFLLGCTSVS
jgi:serine/threonine protein kinase